MKRHHALFATTLVLLAGCSGRSGSGSLIPGSATSPAKNGTASVAFTMHWSTGSAASSGSTRRPAYVPATARSVTVSVNGGAPQYLNSPSTTLTISAPAGVDSFLIQTFDEQNGQGNVLSQAGITQTVKIDTANVLSATLNGVIASLQVTLGTPTPNAGTSTTSTVTVAALDADGNTIVGPGDYNTPIKLSIQDPSSSGTLTLSSTLLQTPGTGVTLSYNGGLLWNANVVATAAGVPNATVQFAPKPTAYEYALPSAGSQPAAITLGPDGNMWFTENIENAIGKITSSGVITEYPIPTSNSKPVGITAGKDGALWFTENNSSKIGRITVSGTIQEFPTHFAGDGPFLIHERGDGTVWYAGQNGSDVSFQDETTNATGAYSTFTANANPIDVAFSPDGTVYATESSVGRIGQFNNSGVTDVHVGGQPYTIVYGPDGNLWFADDVSSKIVQLAPGSLNVVNSYPTITPNATPAGIAIGNDGALWFTEYAVDKVGRVTTNGTVSEYSLPSSGVQPFGIAAAADGSIWITEIKSGKIARLVY
jgi:virginiamycin B lyase